MKYLKLFIILLPLQILVAQPDKGVYWGVAIDAKLLFENSNGSSHSELLPPPNLYVHFGNVFNQYLKLDISVGYVSFSKNWDGFDLGLFLKSQVLGNIYSNLGFNYNPLLSYAGSGNGNQEPIYNQKDFIYGGLGIGYLLTKTAYVEFNYQIPLNSDKVYGTSYYIQTSSLLKLNGRLKLDFGWNFSF